ncbi:hypothetical protein [Phaeobacter sp.]|uniref:glycosyltransferase n=1 Tax=Phaeobacter sp. TaxID=1902409 RepID=UPI0025D48573|nr:hypothetical protein [Phaeobacter sp.]
MQIPLFFHGYDLKAYDFPAGQPLSVLRERLRFHYRSMRNLQPRTGFYTAFLNLAKSLEQLGHQVRINDFAFARTNPNLPVGMSGYLPPFGQSGLKNPVLYGPGRVPDPTELGALQAQLNLKIVTYPSEWPKELAAKDMPITYAAMFVGIDTDEWPDMSGSDKKVDFLLYNKIHWHKAERAQDLLAPLRQHLRDRNLTWAELEYGSHTPAQYKTAIRESRALIFCTEHETQGLACQEAMAANVPVFAWDEGRLSDPSQIAIAPPDLRPSSVPYFDARCGLTFRISTLEEQLDRFMAARDSYRPRDYVLENLSLEQGARRFLTLYESLLS